MQSSSTTQARGPSFLDHRRRMFQREIDRAKRLGRDMFKGRKIDRNSSHRPPPNPKNTKQKSKGQSNKLLEMK